MEIVLGITLYPASDSSMVCVLRHSILKCMKANQQLQGKNASTLKFISCPRTEQSRDNLSHVNFIIQEAASLEPKCTSTWHLLQLGSRKCVAPRSWILGMTCVLGEA